MTHQEKSTAKPSLRSTKKEILDAYNLLLRQQQERRKTELKPEKQIEERKTRQALDAADSLTIDGVVTEIAALKSGIGKALSEISEKLEHEVGQYEQVRKAIRVKEEELREIYSIEKEAESLAALIEVHHLKREELEAGSVLRKETLTGEIETIRLKHQEEKQRLEAESKERKAEKAKSRGRENEEYDYVSKRERKLARDQFEDEKAATEKELRQKKEEVEKKLTEREQAVRAREKELEELSQRVESFPAQLESAIQEAVQETKERMQQETGTREEMAKKEFEGERKVLTTRVDSLEATIKEQFQRIAKLTQQLEKSYQQVQDIAVKSVESAAGAQAMSGVQQLLKQTVEKKES